MIHNMLPYILAVIHRLLVNLLSNIPIPKTSQKIKNPILHQRQSAADDIIHIYHMYLVVDIYIQYTQYIEVYSK